MLALKIYNKEMRHKAIVNKEKVAMSTTVWNRNNNKKTDFEKQQMKRVEH